MGMIVSDTKIAGVRLIETGSVIDHRGSFSRWFCTKELACVLEGRTLAQINNSKSLNVGTVRGLHFQKPPHAEMKIVCCIRGRVWDVALDLRAGSPTFLQWFGVELTPENGLMLAVPEGFSHGYQSLEAESELLYFNTEFYTPAFEGAIHHADPRAAIEWPLPVTDLSDRDASCPFLSQEFEGINV